MTAILTVLVLSGICMYLLYSGVIADDGKRLKSRTETPGIMFALMVLAAFIIRLICAAKYSGHKTDMQCFNSWSSMIFNNGISNFYASESFTDYPPGYMYILYVIGAIKSLFKLSSATVLLKLPAIICDILTGGLIWKMAKKNFGVNASLVIAAVYLFNPATVVNSALWGQVDAVYTLVMAVMLYFIANKKMIPAYFLFAVCIFIKPQALIVTPVLIFGIIETVFLPKLDKKLFWKNLGFGLGAVLFMVIMALPFGIGNVIEQYKKTLESYQYATVNAFNMWGAFGMNWNELTPLISFVGTAALVLIVAYSAYLFFKSKNPAKYYFTAALLVFTTYMLSTKMHDRYAFPAMVLLLMAFITKPDIHGFGMYSLVTLSQMFNTAWVLFIYEQDINKYFKSPVIVAASWINIAIYIYIMYNSKKRYIDYKEPVKAEAKKGKKQQKQQPKQMPPAPEKRLSAPKIQTSDLAGKMTARDWIIVAAITLVYGAVALYNLGDMDAPETHVDLYNNPVTIDCGKEVEISRYGFFNGSKEFGEERALTIEFRDESKKVIKTEQITSAAVFYWTQKSVSTVNARYVTLSTNAADRLELNEFYMKDSSGQKIEPEIKQEYSALFDEQELVPDRATFKNGTIFDEIYHARTGYEFVNHLPVYEWTHPPFGKVLIALGIKIFGMNPFGWRIAGTFIGILMVPVIYLFAKSLLKKTWLAALTCLLYTVDFMHFTQSRIATIDVYATFFIMLMYYLMFRYLSLSFYDTPLKKTFIPLGLCGIAMGFGIASKWTGIYAAMGLAVLFFISLYKRYKEYLYAKKFPSKETNGIKHKDIIEKFPVYTRNTIIFCCIFFIVVPALIYAGSYFMYLQAPDSHGLKTILENQSAMYTYHSKTVVGSEHPYSSRWYEWIVMKKPILYYTGTTAEGLKEGISAFGNPAVWWTGFAAMMYMAYMWLAKKDKKAGFLFIAYLAQIVSWIPITRLTFIYHYFPSVPFLALAIGYAVKLFYDKARRKKGVIAAYAVYAAIAVGLFVMFYPVLSGYPITAEYGKMLKWFDWVLII